jgi:molecular chaperone Hsp33
MPKAARDESLVTLLESRIASLSGFTPLLQSGKSLPTIFSDLLGDLGLNILPEVQMLRFNCQCSHDRMMRALKLLGRDELIDMIETDGSAEAVCEFCRSVYNADINDLNQLVRDLEGDGSNG